MVNPISTYDMQQSIELRNEHFKDNYIEEQISKVKLILHTKRGFSEKNSEEFANDMVRFGDKIICNCDKECPHLNAINQIADDCQGLKNNTCLFLITGSIDARESLKQVQDAREMFPIPSKQSMVAKVTSAAEIKAAVEEYMNTKAHQAMSGTIVFLGTMDAYSIMLKPTGMVANSHVLLHLKQMLQKNTKELPKA